MPIQVLLTLDLFLYRWAADDAALWACVQPHVAPADLLAWAWENGRWDILALFGIYMTQEYFEP